jgi:glycolate oxidase iron-sulfur subunit
MKPEFTTLSPLEPLMDKCVHCGFCLATCPSYVLLGQEMASPRGRIYLMRAGLEGRVGMSETFAGHFDTCLGCMACETACPSGVRYAPLVEHTRAAIERHHERPWPERVFRGLLFRILPYPSRLRLLTLPLSMAHLVRRFPQVTALLPPRLRSLLALAPDTPAHREDVAAHTPAKGAKRLSVGLMIGCVQQVFFGEVNQATVRTLTAEGCDVYAPAGQGCCGALALHAGRDEEARAFARRMIAAFETRADRSGPPTDANEPGDTIQQIVVNAAGCGSTMKMYGELLAEDPDWAGRAARFASKVRDVTETLAHLTPQAPRRPIQARVAYHDACHLAHAQGVRAEPRAILQTIPGVEVVQLAEPDICCGSAGIFNLVQPEMAGELGQRKAAHIADARVDLVVTSNPGCILQIRAAMRAQDRPPKVIHIVELLDRAIRSG